MKKLFLIFLFGLSSAFAQESLTINSMTRNVMNTGDVKFGNGKLFSNGLAVDSSLAGKADVTEPIAATHAARTDNPHSVTKTQTGLGNADNTSDANKPVSTAQQTALNLKVNANGTIVSSTKTKITYDTKGLVTAGTDATTADIADSTDKRYVTDAQRTVIGNTSGTNSGDQDLSGLVPKTTTVNGHALSGNVAVTAADVSAPSGSGTSTGTNTGDQDLSGLVPKTTTVNGHALSGNVSVTASDVGLGNANNTTDANKPVSTAQQTALNLKANLAAPTFTGIVTNSSGSTSAHWSSANNSTDLTQNLLFSGGNWNLEDVTLPGWLLLMNSSASTGHFTLYHAPASSNPATLTPFLDVDQTGNATIPGTFGASNFSGTSSGTNTGDNAVNSLYSGLVSNATHTGDVTGATALTLATAQPAAHTWALAQTFTVAPIFTDQSGTRTALGLGTAATTASSAYDAAGAAAAVTPTTLGLVIGTNVEAHAATLASWAAITRASGYDTFTATPTMANFKALLTDETTVGWNLFSAANPSAISFPKVAADNTVSFRTPAQVLSDIGAQASGSYAASGANTDITSITGSAAKWTTARNIAGNSVDGSANVAFANKFVVQGTADTGLSSAQFLGALGTGIVKNTTTTGVLSIAVAGDFPTLNQSTTGSAATLATSRTLAITGDLAWTSPSFDGSGNVTAAGTLPSVATAGTTGSSTAIPVITIDVKGRTTGITTAAVVAPAGTLTGSSLASGVTGSSLTSAAGGSFGTAAYTASTAYATSTQGTTADNALPKAGGTMTGPVYVPSNGSGVTLDSSTGSVLTVANNVTTALTGVAFGGLLIISDTTVTGGFAVIGCPGGGGAPVIGFQSGENAFSAAINTSGKVNIYNSAGTLTLQNKNGSSIDFRIITLRTR
jgi:hypothetical protein